MNGQTNVETQTVYLAPEETEHAVGWDSASGSSSSDSPTNERVRTATVAYDPSVQPDERSDSSEDSW